MMEPAADKLDALINTLHRSNFLSRLQRSAHGSLMIALVLYD